MTKLWDRLTYLLRNGFNGQLILHCVEGRVVKLERREVEKIKST